MRFWCAKCWFLVFCLFLFLSSLLLFHEKQHQNIILQSLCFINPFSVFIFGLVFSLKSLYFFLILSSVFCSTSMVLLSKPSWKTPNVWSRGGCNKRFCYEPVFCKMWKLSFSPFWGNFWLMFKKHYNIGISAHLKCKMTIFNGYCLVQVKVIIWSNVFSTCLCWKNHTHSQNMSKTRVLL